MFGNRGRLATPELDTSPMPQLPQPPVRRRRRKWPWIFLALVVLFVAIAAVAGGGSSVAPVTGSTVVYKVASDASTISVTYATLKNGAVQESQNNSITPPWSTSLSVDRSWTHGYSLVAQMTPASAGGHDGTTISCTITVNGKVIADNTSTGPYATVTCTG